MKHSINEQKMNVEQLIKKQYPNCEILKCHLQYVDWSSTVRDIDENDVFYNRPTRAEATMIMDSIKYDIELERGLFSWSIKGCYSQSVVGTDVIEYYGMIRMSSVGSAVDMEEWCKENWVLHLGDGSLYSLVDHTKEGGSIYYSVKVCDALYIVENKSIKQLRIRDKDWTEADYNYSEIKRYSFIRQLTKEEFDEILSLKPFSTKEKINKLVHMGKIPNDSELSDEDFEMYDTLLSSFEEKLSFEEAEQIINLFSNDCDDLNWALLHVIETVPFAETERYSQLIVKCENAEWKERLQQRFANWLKKQI